MGHSRQYKKILGDKCRPKVTYGDNDNSGNGGSFLSSNDINTMWVVYTNEMHKLVEDEVC